MKYLIPFAILLLFTAASCRKNKTTEQLPPETHEGKFTIGFKVDGKIYTAEGKGGLLSSEHVKYSLISTDSSINIFAANTSNLKPKFHLALVIKFKGAQGIYDMKSYPYQGDFMDASNGTIPGGTNNFNTSDAHIGKVNIKYFNGSYSPPFKGSILSGTFEMEAINNEGKVIHITEGRFDIGQ